LGWTYTQNWMIGLGGSIYKTPHKLVICRILKWSSEKGNVDQSYIWV